MFNVLSTFLFARFSLMFVCKVLIDFFKLSFEQIHELGMRSRRYVDKWHDPQKNVSNLARELELLNNFT